MNSMAARTHAGPYSSDRSRALATDLQRALPQVATSHQLYLGRQLQTPYLLTTLPKRNVN